jgi:hypothetical protein
VIKKIEIIQYTEKDLKRLEAGFNSHFNSNIEPPRKEKKKRDKSKRKSGSPPKGSRMD